MISITQQSQRIVITLDSANIQPLDSTWQQALQGLLQQLQQQTAAGTAAALVQINFQSDKLDRHNAQPSALSREQAAACMQQLADYHELLRQLERLPVPTVAVLHGNIGEHAWGLALACHRRYSLGTALIHPRPAAPGLAPCGGVLVRTARLLGLQAALPLLLDGFELDSSIALELGLLHGAASDAPELEQSLLRAASMPRPPLQPWDEKRPLLPGGAVDSAGNLAFLQLAPARLRARADGATAAARAILCALAESLQVDFDTAVRIESRYFCQSAIALNG